MAPFKLNTKLGWLEFASVFALLVFIFYKKVTSLFENNKPQTREKASANKPSEPLDNKNSSVRLTGDEQKKVLSVTESILFVINHYIYFILIISDSFTEEEESEAEKKNEMRKFLAVKKELRDFLNAHKRFFTLKDIFVEAEDGSRLYERDVNNDDENFLSEDDALEMYEFFKDGDAFVSSGIDYNDVDILETLKSKTGKSAITNKDVQQFVENNYLFDNINFDVKKSNYTDLIAYIKQRTVDYCYSKVSTENINGMSFSYQRLVGVFKDVDTCPVCLEDYETDQEVCRLPCNHFCCRVCTERMFSTPIMDNPEEYGYNVSCPICRINCA